MPEPLPPLESNPPELFQEACAALGVDGPGLAAARGEVAQLAAGLGVRTLAT